MPGTSGAELARWVANQGLPEAELSDLQRAEARYQLARRDVAPVADPGLDARLHAFMSRTATFAIPNPKVAYELTHIVFYLSHYGQRDPGLSDTALRSLNYAGTLAWLDENTDILAEVCIALRYAGQTPPGEWEDKVLSDLSAAQINDGDAATGADDYHTFLVSGWLAALTGAPAIGMAIPDGRCTFRMRNPVQSPLRQMSHALRGLPARWGGWDRVGQQLTLGVDEETYDTLRIAQETCDDFDAFFSEFARASGPVLATA